ncbi:MAG TPA: hypothetical protein VKR58_12670 [Aquella sp.]|nr:hypothetical protein [Aquella sp.]
MKDPIIITWEKIGIAISLVVIFIVGVLEINANCWIKNHPTIISILTGLACGFIATIIVLVLERQYEKKKLREYYIKYEGLYSRTDIGQDNTPESDLVNMREENNDLIIEMTYIGGHEFLLLINYWKSENAQAQGIVEFNPKDKQLGKGNYRYIAGKSYKGHYGRLDLNWDENNKEMVIIYNHQYPREIPFNPDKNRGWEIWTKTKDNQAMKRNENKTLDQPWIKNASSTLVLYSIMAATCVVFFVLILPSAQGPFPIHWGWPLALVGIAFFLYVFSAEAISEALDQNDIYKYISTHFLYNLATICLVTGITFTVYFHSRNYFHDVLASWVWIERRYLIATFVLIVNFHWIYDLWWLLRKSDDELEQYIELLKGNNIANYEKKLWNWNELFRIIRKISSKKS